MESFSFQTDLYRAQAVNVYLISCPERRGDQLDEIPDMTEPYFIQMMVRVAMISHYEQPGEAAVNLNLRLAMAASVHRISKS